MERGAWQAMVHVITKKNGHGLTTKQQINKAKKRKYVKDKAGVRCLDSLNGVFSVEDFRINHKYGEGK